MLLFFAVPLSILSLLISLLCYRADCIKQAIIFSLLGFTLLGAATLMAVASHWLLQNL